MYTRLTPEKALAMYHEENVFHLGKKAHAMRFKLHPAPEVTYIVDRNINYTNICISGCKFCAFFRPPGHKEGYVLSREVLAKKIRETIALGGRQILLQGGMNPDLDLDYYEDLLCFLKKDFPQVAIHGFSPTEIWFLTEQSGIELREVLKRLMAAGVDSIPGGGAEILTNRMRNTFSPHKCTADQWLDVMRQAHLLGLKTTATMMFGQGEEIAERIEHLERLRTLQDETGGFTAFIPWTFQPDHTKNPRPEASGTEYLKTLALSRLYLDNIANIQASWVTQGPHIGQLALFFGANDFGSTMIEENVVAATGVQFSLPEENLCSLVQRAGFQPVKRRMDYSRIHA